MLGGGGIGMDFGVLMMGGFGGGAGFGRCISLPIGIGGRRMCCRSPVGILGMAGPIFSFSSSGLGDEGNISMED